MTKKRIISLFLALLLMCQLAPAAVAAEGETDEGPVITGIEVIRSAGSATVTLNAGDANALLIVALYTPELQLEETKMARVSAGEGTVTLNFSRSFRDGAAHIHAMLVDPETYAPLCDSYTKYSESQVRTIDDFDPELVLNFDDQKDENFAALADGVVLLNEGDFSRLEARDTEDEVSYTLYGVTSAARNRLKTGAPVVLFDGEEYSPIEAASVSADGSTVTIVGGVPDEDSLGNFFDYLSIDHTIERLDGIEAQTEEGIELEDPPVSLMDEGSENEYQGRLYFTIDKEFENGIHVKGEIAPKITVQVIILFKKTLLGQPYYYYDVFVDADSSVELTLSASVGNAPEGDSGAVKERDFEIPLLPDVPIPFPGKPATSATLDITIPIRGELEGSIGVTGDVHTHRRLYGDGVIPIVEEDISIDNVSAEAQVSLTLNLGLQVRVTVGVLKELVYVEVGAEGGVECTFTVSKSLSDPLPKTRHLCQACVEGESVTYLRGWLEFGLDLVENKKLILLALEGEKKWPARECYISLYDGKFTFGWGTCPRILYLGQFLVCDMKTDMELTGASVSVESCADGSTVLTGASGKYDYLPAGEYRVTGQCKGYEVNTVTGTVPMSGDGIIVYLTPYEGDDPNEPIHGGGATGTYNNGITEEYRLYPDGYFYGTASSGTPGMLSKEANAYSWRLNAATRNSIVHVDLSDGVFTSIGAFAFQNCSNLVRADLDQRITHIQRYAFDGCRNLETINIPSSAQVIGEYAFQNCAKLRSPLSFNDVHINQFAFANCSALPSLSVGAGTIDAKAFSNCSSLESASLGNIGGIADGLFVNCKNLSQVTLSEGITSIGNSAFGGCSSLQTIEIPGSVETLGTSAFSEAGITSLTIPGNVTSMGMYLASKCTLLEELVLENGVKEIAQQSFNGCRSLKRVSLPDSLVSIGKEAFADDTGLESIVIPGSAGMIGDQVFKGCILLSSVTLSRGVSAISNFMFRDCISLCEITIPASVTSIGNGAFYQSGLRDVYYQGTEAQWAQISVASDAFGSGVAVHFLGE